MDHAHLFLGKLHVLAAADKYDNVFDELDNAGSEFSSNSVMLLTDQLSQTSDKNESYALSSALNLYVCFTLNLLRILGG